MSVSVPIYIDSWALVGTYKIEIDVKTSSGETGCVKISNVHIQSNGWTHQSKSFLVLKMIYESSD